MSDLEYQNEQVYFLTFCIEQYKHIKNIDGLTVKQMFDKIGLTDYLTKNYEVLHTQSKQWILDDIEAFIKAGRKKSDFISW